ncbi:MAG: hypothetical protein ABI346_06715 [Candidatus Baltobacteraceae bacterium]
MNKAAHQRAKFGVRRTRKSRALRTQMLKIGIWIFIVVFAASVAGVAIAIVIHPQGK